MTDHLSPSLLSSLADGELSAEQLGMANGHLAVCPACTSNALYQSLLKTATAKAGRRYTPPPQLQERLTALASRAKAKPAIARSRFAMMGWVMAAMVLVVWSSLLVMQRATRVSTERAALVSEVFDQHMATLAASGAPQVVSTDRHTVKPWFQGRIPFSFNLPENLPQDTTLGGANLVYLHKQPVAQLLYSIGRHRVSVFIQQKQGAVQATATERSGFHVMDFSTPELEAVAISDVDPVRLKELVAAIKLAQ